MTVLPINPDSTALFYTEDDLLSRGICTETLTEDDVLELAKSALRRFDLTLSELEAYAGQYGLLIFTYAAQAGQRLWYFDDFERLLSAAAVHMTGGALYRWQDGWWLVTDSSGDSALSEFAAEISDAAQMLPRLHEYGELIVPAEGFSAFRDAFIKQ